MRRFGLVLENVRMKEGIMSIITLFPSNFLIFKRSNKNFKICVFSQINKAMSGRISTKFSIHPMEKYTPCTSSSLDSSRRDRFCTISSNPFCHRIGEVESVVMMGYRLCLKISSNPLCDTVESNVRERVL